jgi:hypothetical protein
MWWCVGVNGHDVLQEPCIVWSSHQEILTQQNSDTHQITCILSNIVVRTSNLPHTILPEVSSVNSYFLFTNSHTSIKLTSLVLQDSQNYECDNKTIFICSNKCITLLEQIKIMNENARWNSEIQVTINIYEFWHVLSLEVFSVVWLWIVVLWPQQCTTE